MGAIVLLARHATHSEVGKRLSGRSEVALNEEGRAEAALLGERLREHRIGAIHSSPRRRALETAGSVAQRTGLPIETVAALDEINFGDWTGRSFDSLEEEPLWQRWNAERGAAVPPSGESMAAATARAVAHVETAATAQGTTLMVTHGDIIRGIVAHYLGLPLDRLLRFDVDPASLTLLDVTPDGGRLIALNERI